MRPLHMLLLIPLFCTSAMLPAATADEAADDGVRTVYLVRHGHYDWQDEADPEVGKALVPIGVAQARLLGARLRGLPEELDSLTSSTMTRARQTAAIVAQEFPALEMTATPLLSECTPTTRRDDIMADEDPAEVAACEARLEKAFATVLAPSPKADRHDLVVCHGNVIRYFITRALDVDPHAWLGMSIGNCSLTEIKIFADGSMKVIRFSDSGHIPPNLHTGTWPGVERDLALP